MARKTYIVLLVVLTIVLTLAFGTIASADSGKPASEVASGGTTTGSSGPSLANNIYPNPAPEDTAGGNTADGKYISGVGTATGLLTGLILASNGNPSATVPSSGNTTTGAAAGMFGDPVHGQIVYEGSCSACHGTAGLPTLAYPGLADVQNPDTSYSIDPELYDLNPAFFARNMDPFLQHGSAPVGPPAPMPAYGDLQLLSQIQIADTEAYVMGLSNVKWPRLSLSGSVLTGSDFVPLSTVQLYRDGVALGAPVTVDVNGNFVIPFTISSTQMVIITANYAILNVLGIYPNGNSELGELGLDADRGATVKVASIPLGNVPQAQAVRAASLPSTGVNLFEIWLIAGLTLMAGMTILATVKPRSHRH